MTMQTVYTRGEKEGKKKVGDEGEGAGKKPYTGVV